MTKTDSSGSSIPSYNFFFFCFILTTQFQYGVGLQQTTLVAMTPIRNDLYYKPTCGNHVKQACKRASAMMYVSSSAADEWYHRRQSYRNSDQSSTTSSSQIERRQDAKRYTERDLQRVLKDYAVPSTNQVLGFAIPAVGVWLCIPLLSMIDTSVVGSIAGTSQLAALNPAIAVMTYSSKLMSFLFSGTTAILAAAMAADQRQALKTKKQSASSTERQPKTAKSLQGVLQFSTMVGAGLGTLLFTFAKPMLLAIIGGEADPTILAAAMKYVKIRALGMPAAAMLGSAQTACLAQGDAKMPLHATVVAALSNLVLDLALIRNSNPWIGGAAGAAWGTSAAQFLAAGWVIKWLLSRNTSDSNSKSTRGFLAGRMSFKDVFRIPTKETSKGFAPFVFPVITTQAGRSSASATIDHVVSSSLSTTSMAANQILTSVYYGLIPIVESLSLAAQAFVPKVTERGGLDHLSREQQRTLQKEKSYAMRELLTSFTKAAGLCGLVLAAVIGTLPLYSGAFTPDVAVQKLVATVVPLIFLTSLKHGLFCASEGVLLGQKDLKFLGGQYAVYTFLIPYMLLQVKRAALNGSQSVGLASVWQIFVGYDIFRTLVQMGRIAWLERKRSRAP
jgi:Na+-driven multidrug efflux pump